MAMWRTILRGIAAGLAGAAAMHGFRLCWEAVVHDREQDGIFGFDRKADIESADIVHTWLFRESLPPEQAARLGIALHYAYGASLGMLYAITEAGFNRVGVFRPLRIGFLLWLFADELPISLARISNPFRRSMSSYASALAAHIVFALATDATLRFALTTAVTKEEHG